MLDKKVWSCGTCAIPVTICRFAVCCTLVLLVVVGGCYKSPYNNIFEAVEKGTIKDVKYFVSKGADVNARDQRGNTLLHRVASTAPIELIKYLVEHGADIHVKNDYEVSALHLAVENPDIGILKYLIAQGADVNAYSERVGTPVHRIARIRDHVEHLKYLIENGADVNIRTSQGLTPIDMLELKKGDPSPDGFIQFFLSESENSENIPELIEVLRAAGGKKGNEL